MWTGNKLKILTGLSSAVLFITLLFKLKYIGGGMILPGLVLGGIIIIVIIIACLLLAGILKLIFKKTSFITLVFITTIPAFLIFHYVLYSPTLTIQVPNGYTGEINLVLSNVSNNMLTVDSNGVGYLNKWTFNKVYSKPIVVQLDGKSLENNLVGFSPSTFFGLAKTCCVNGHEIESLSFEIAPAGKIGQKQYYTKALTTLVNKQWVAY